MLRSSILPALATLLTGTALVLLISSCTEPRAVTVTDASGSAAGTLRGELQDGWWEYRSPAGTRQAEGPWRRDLRHGSWRYFHENGALAASGDYGQGLRQGLWQHYHDDGSTVAASGAFVDDLQHGLWVYRNEAGQVSASGVFIHGARALGWWRWDEASNPQGLHLLHQGRQLLHSEDAELRAQFSIAGTTISQQGLVTQWIDQDGPRWTLEVAPGPVITLSDHHSGDLWQVEAGELTLSTGQARNNDPKADTVVVSSDAEQVDLSTAPLAPALLWDETAVEVSPAPVAGISGWSQRETARATLASAVYGGEGSFPYASSNRGGRYQRMASTPANRQRSDLLGQTLPQQRFIQAGDGVLDLRSRQGRPQVIVILRGFAGSICPYCSGQSRAMLDHHSDFAERAADMTFIYPGPSTSLPTFVQAVRNLGDTELPPFTVALDIDLALVQALGIGAELAFPTTIILDTNGIIRYAYVGRDLMDRPTVDHILEGLDALANGDHGP